VTASSVFYDAVFLGSVGSGSGSSGGNGSSGTASANASGGCPPLSAMLDAYSAAFLTQAYAHGKPIGWLGGGDDEAVLECLWQGLVANGGGNGGAQNVTAGLYGSGGAGTVTEDILQALSGPVRFFERFATDDVGFICSSQAGP
jgi:hypothetical protein